MDDEQVNLETKNSASFYGNNDFGSERKEKDDLNEDLAKLD